MYNIWFVSHYSMPPEYEMRIKTQMYSLILNEKGYNTTIFSASTIHNTTINLIDSRRTLYVEKNYKSLKFIHIRARKYRGNGISRILNMFDFTKNFVKVAKHFQKPNVIVADANCINYSTIYKYCKKNKIPFILEVRDLWPLSIVEFYKYRNSNLMIRYLYLREKIMYDHANQIIFSMPGYKTYLSDINFASDEILRKCHYINNGIDLKQFEEYKKEYIYNDPSFNRKDIFKVVYTGSIRTANGVQLLIDALKQLLNNDLPIYLFLFGIGDQVDLLKKYCEVSNINNVFFMGFVEKKYVPSILVEADLLLFHYKHNILTKYGGSQNKLFEYLASGTPILQTITSPYDLVDGQVGLSVDCKSPEDIKNAILDLYDKINQQIIKKEVAQERANQYDYHILTNNLEKIILSELSKKL